jgi:hypothetical protein
MHSQCRGVRGTDSATGTGYYRYFAFESFCHFLLHTSYFRFFQQDIQIASGWGIKTVHRVVDGIVERGCLFVRETAVSHFLNKAQSKCYAIAMRVVNQTN